MKIGILASKQDAAGMNIADKLIRHFGFTQGDDEFHGYPVYGKEEAGNAFRLVIMEESLLEADFVDELEAELLVFASRHTSQSGKSTLSVHPIGNFGEAKYGGQAGKVVQSAPGIMRNYYVYLRQQAEQRQLDFSVSMEVTHHGPLVRKPSVFVESGSHEPQWKDPTAGALIAETIVHRTREDGTGKVALGIGGNHYCAIFNKLMNKHPYAFSHVIPQYALPDLDEELLRQVMAASTHKVEEIVVDEKGLGKEKRRIMQLAGETGIPVQKAREIGI